jgi:hypothetical protein
MALAHTLCRAQATFVLLSVLCVACAAECPNAFSGLTTCAVLNGQNSVGSALDLTNMTSGVEARVQDSYASLSLPFVKGIECKALYEAFLCWQSAKINITGRCLDGVDVASSVTPFLACSQWCTEAMASVHECVHAQRDTRRHSRTVLEVHLCTARTRVYGQPRHAR